MNQRPTLWAYTTAGPTGFTEPGRAGSRTWRQGRMRPSHLRSAPHQNTGSTGSRYSSDRPSSSTMLALVSPPGSAPPELLDGPRPWRGGGGGPRGPRGRGGGGGNGRRSRSVWVSGLGWSGFVAVFSPMRSLTDSRFKIQDGFIIHNNYRAVAGNEIL